MDLTPEQKREVQAAFARGKAAEAQYAAGLPVTQSLTTGVRSGDDMRSTPEEIATLTELRAIEVALKNASEETRVMLVDSFQSPNEWLDRVVERIHLIETSVNPVHIGDELVRIGALTDEEVLGRDYSAAGLAHHYARFEAVEALRQIWVAEYGASKAKRGGHRNTSSRVDGDFYRFNDFVLWLGKQLLDIDPSLATGRKTPRQEGDNTNKRTSLENACYQSWLILGELRE